MKIMIVAVDILAGIGVCWVCTVVMNDSFYRQFGQNLRKARREAGLSQADLALAITLTRASVSNIENGRQGISLHTFGKMLRVLNVQPGQLLPAAHAPSTLRPPGLTSLAQQDRDFVERGLRRLGKDNNGSSFDANPQDNEGIASET